MLDIEEVKRLEQNGLLYGEIADRLGVSLEDVITATGGFIKTVEQNNGTENIVKRRREEVKSLKNKG